MQLQPVASTEITTFRRMVDAYWEELMPTADVLKTAAQRDTYFDQRFSWLDGQPPFWAVVDGQAIGFVHVALTLAQRQATIEDFYVLPDQRRHGYGTAIVQALARHFDSQGIELIELNVRRDNPTALAFWEAQGFRIAVFRMRQYRDPRRGLAYIGALSSDFEPEAGSADGTIPQP